MVKLVDKNEIEMIKNVLIHEGIVAFPTETVYGLASIYNSTKALNQLFEAKHRPSNKSITMMVSKVEDIKNYAYVSSRDMKVIRSFMPGAITIILNKKENVSLEMTCGKETIGIRIPDDNFVRDLIERLGKPLMVTSANLSGEKDSLTSDDVYQQLGESVNLIVEGKSGGLKPSSVVDLTQEKVRVLRQGDLTLEEINLVLGGV